MGWVSSLPVPSLAQAPFLPGPTLFPPPPPQGSSASRNLVGGGCRGPYWATGRGQPREVTKPWIKGRKAGAGSRALVCWSLLRTPDMKLILSALLSLWVLGECRYSGECPPAERPGPCVPPGGGGGHGRCTPQGGGHVTASLRVGAPVPARCRVGTQCLQPRRHQGLGSDLAHQPGEQLERPLRSLKPAAESLEPRRSPTPRPLLFYP